MCWTPYGTKRIVSNVERTIHFLLVTSVVHKNYSKECVYIFIGYIYFQRITLGVGRCWCNLQSAGNSGGGLHVVLSYIQINHYIDITDHGTEYTPNTRVLTHTHPNRLPHKNSHILLSR